MNPKARKDSVNAPKDDAKTSNKRDIDQRRRTPPIEGEQPLAEDETKEGGIEGAVGGGQSGQGGG